MLYQDSHSIVFNHNTPNVIELHLEMTSNMLQLQNSILDLIKITVQELKRLNPTLDAEEITVESAIQKSFHKLLHSQLDPVWHALSERTKVLITDLKLLHHMIISLLTMDSVSFYALVNSQRKSERVIKSSGWHLLPSAEILFNISKVRVFGGSNDFSKVNAEPNPKWIILSEVLSEIHKNLQKFVPKRENIVEEVKDVEQQLEEMFNSEISTELKTDVSSKNCEENKPDTILVLVRDIKTCNQLRLYLTMGADELLSIQYRKCFGFKKNAVAAKEKSSDSGNKKAKVEADVGKEEEIEEEEEEEEILHNNTFSLALSQDVLNKLKSEVTVNVAGCFEESFYSQKNTNDDKDTKDIESTSVNAPIIMIQSFKRDWISLTKTLDEMKPRWVIMYDSDVTIVRQLEVFQRNNQQIPLTVYFLVYGGTVEEQAYLSSLRKEKEAFTHLIAEKARIVIPENIDDCAEFTRDIQKANETVANTRKGGIEMERTQTPKIIVDMREFRSELPALIHSRGIDIEPLTLTVGDYILTPDICLERKSVSDLIQSLNSGRLYNQAVALTRHYARPMLLIEFDKDKPFDLQDRYYLSTDTSSDQIVTKLQLLTLHFPQLRLIWSPSPHATAQLFEELKQGRPEPDISTAATLGIEQFASDEDKYNPAVHNFLLKLPGVTTKNVHTILRQGGSLDKLRSLSVSEINELLENNIEAQSLYNAFHVAHRPNESAGGAPIRGKGRVAGGSVRGKRKRFH